jgi:hypothetical protein
MTARTNQAQRFINLQRLLHPLGEHGGALKAGCPLYESAGFLRFSANDRDQPAICLGWSEQCHKSWRRQRPDNVRFFMSGVVFPT